ncbi:hypothetical protein HKX48_006574 [Thoreauomyces humboldtii]|nr:hypothetical protein HKX48_006574 [Thoreauomyces humboldtii]
MVASNSTKPDSLSDPTTVEPIDVFPSAVALIFFCASILIGLANVMHIIMLISYVASTVNGYAYCRGNLFAYDIGFHVADGTFILGSFLLLLTVENFLPAVSLRMAYNELWNKAVKFLTWALFGITITGFVIATGIIAHYQIVLRPTTSDNTLELAVSVRAICFTTWSAWAPFVAAAISIVVIRLVIAVKVSLTRTATGAQISSGPDKKTAMAFRKEMLEKVQIKAFATTCVAIPATLVVAGATILPYSVIIDGITTAYTSLFCTWILYDITLIRAIVSYSPLSASGNLLHSRTTNGGIRSKIYSQTESMPSDAPFRAADDSVIGWTAAGSAVVSRRVVGTGESVIPDEKRPRTNYESPFSIEAMSGLGLGLDLGLELHPGSDLGVDGGGENESTGTAMDGHDEETGSRLPSHAQEKQTAR